MGEGGGAEPRRMRVGWRKRRSRPGETTLTLSPRDDGCAVVGSSPLPTGEGSDRDASVPRRRLDGPGLVQQLGDLDGVEGRALAQIVGDDPQRQAVLDRVVLADARDI